MGPVDDIYLFIINIYVIIKIKEEVMTTWPGLLLKTMCEFMVLQWLGSVLMSLAHVAAIPMVLAAT